MTRQLNYIVRQVVTGSVSIIQPSKVIGDYWKVSWRAYEPAGNPALSQHPPPTQQFVTTIQTARLSRKADADQLYAILLLQQTERPSHDTP